MEIIDVITGILALIGLILVAVGRWMLSSEVSGMSWWWRFSARYLPMADLLILSRFWDTAKNGAFTAMAGMLLLLPAGALRLYKAQQIKPGEMASVMSTDAKAGLYNEMKSEHDAKIQTRQDKCAKLNSYLTVWYQNMASRRPALAKARPDEIAQFNKEAAAYGAFRAIVQDETNQLAALQSQPYDFGNIKNEDFEAFEAEQEKRQAAAVASFRQ